MKKIILLIVMLISVLSCGCIAVTDRIDISVESGEQVFLTIGTRRILPASIEGKNVEWSSTDDDIVSVTNNVLTALDYGSCILQAYRNEKVLYEYIAIVTDESVATIDISGSNSLYTGDETTLTATTTPLSAVVAWEINDPEIASITSEGNNLIVEAKQEGLVTITASAQGVTKEFYILCLEKREEVVDNIFKTNTEVIDASGLSSIIKPLVDVANSYSFQLLIYNHNFQQTAGTLVVYKRTEEAEGYQYYAITNRHTLENGNQYAILINDVKTTVELVQYDSKVDLAVMRFSSPYYIPTATFGDSDDVESGEFVIAVSNQTNYQQTATIGIVSYPNRYLSDDTDNDGISDWDSQYIQHDAPLSEGSSGGPLVNMRGEVIGINTMKITSDSIENMCFAIPSDLLTELIEVLETGSQPNRPVLGVTIISVLDIKSSEAQQEIYYIPSEITYGMYVTEVTRGGLAAQAGVQIGDIIIKFNDVDAKYSYVLRAAIGELYYGSGEVVPILVYRNGTYLTLYATF